MACGIVEKEKVKLNSHMIIKKIVYGYVVQTFEGDDCVEQEFIAGDQVEWEDENGEQLDLDFTPYHPMEMKQPSKD